MPRPRRNFKVDEEIVFLVHICVLTFLNLFSRIENVAVYKMFSLFARLRIYARRVSIGKKGNTSIQFSSFCTIKFINSSYNIFINIHFFFNAKLHVSNSLSFW